MRAHPEKEFEGLLSPEYDDGAGLFRTDQGINDFKQIEIVPTNIDRYITGVYALNIPDEEGTTGDWHSNVFWRPKDETKVVEISIGGEGDFDTNHIFSDMGVSESYERVKDCGLHIPDNIDDVYVANHIRATLDLAYSELKQHGKIWYVRGCTNDWMDTEEQKQTLLEYATELKNYFSGEKLEELNDWLEYEKNLQQ